MRPTSLLTAVVMERRQNRSIFSWPRSAPVPGSTSSTSRQARAIPVAGAGLTLSPERDPETGLIGKITIEIDLPEDFPEKYEEAVKRAAELCTVKKHLNRPPVFEIYTTADRSLASAAF